MSFGKTFEWKDTISVFSQVVLKHYMRRKNKPAFVVYFLSKTSVEIYLRQTMFIEILAENVIKRLSETQCMR